MKHNNIHIIEIPEGEEKEQGTESLFEEVDRYTVPPHKPNVGHQLI